MAHLEPMQWVSYLVLVLVTSIAVVSPIGSFASKSSGLCSDVSPQHAALSSVAAGASVVSKKLCGDNVGGSNDSMWPITHHPIDAALGAKSKWEEPAISDWPVELQHRCSMQGATTLQKMWAAPLLWIGDLRRAAADFNSKAGDGDIHPIMCLQCNHLLLLANLNFQATVAIQLRP